MLEVDMHFQEKAPSIGCDFFLVESVIMQINIVFQKWSNVIS